MKNTDTQLVKIANKPCLAIMERYSILYEGISEHHVRQMLNRLFRNSEDDEREQGSLRVSNYVNRKRVA